MELWHWHLMAFYPGWTFKWYSMEFQGTLESSNKKSPSSMRFNGIKRAPLQMTQIFHGIPWNIPWNSGAPQLTYHLVPWNSMEHSMEFHGIFVPPNDISLSSMEFHGTLVPPNDISICSMEFHGTFHGTLVPPNDISLCSMEFRGRFHGIPWNFGAAKWHIT